MREISPMRLKRFPLVEKNKGADLVNANAKGQKSGKLNKDHAAAMPNVQWFPTMTPYRHMRTMILAASLPDAPQIAVDSPIADQPFSIAYTDADRDIIDRAAKLCGFDSVKLSDKHSRESDEVHKISPVSTSRNIF